MVQAAEQSFYEKNCRYVAEIQRILPKTTRIDVRYETFSRKLTPPYQRTLSTEETQEVLRLLQGLSPLQQRGKRYKKYAGAHHLVFFDEGGKSIGSLSMLFVTATPQSATDIRYSADAKMSLPPADFKRLRQIIARTQTK